MCVCVTCGHNTNSLLAINVTSSLLCVGHLGLIAGSGAGEMQGTCLFTVVTPTGPDRCQSQTQQSSHPLGRESENALMNVFPYMLLCCIL